MIGIVYSYLPFMLLPLYSALERQDPALREAAADLGTPPMQVFLRVTLPLSWPGVSPAASWCSFQRWANSSFRIYLGVRRR